MAPEQAAGDPDTNHRADIYAFGCMAYELLVGRPPFTGRNPQSLLAAHMAETPDSVKQLRPDTPDLLAQLVMRCLEKDPDKRPQDAGALVHVLETVTSGGGHTAMPDVLLGGRGMMGKALAAYIAAFVFVAVLAKAAIVGIGLPDWVLPGALVVMALGLPVILFTAYVYRTTHRAITTTPTYTPGGTPSTDHGTMATLALKAGPHVSWRRAWLGGAVAVGAFVVVIAGYMVLRALGIGPAGSLFAAGTLHQNERLLVADFSISSSDSSMGPVITDAFRTALGQSSSITVMQPNELRDVLRRMQRPASSRVDFAAAREIATREGIRAVVLGDVISLGGNYAVAVRLVSPQTGEELAKFRETADGPKQLLPAIDALAKELRARIGESLRDVQSAKPLERVTTPSLDALRKYVQATRLLDNATDAPRAMTLLQEAVTIDTGFAMAYRRLAITYSNQFDLDRAMQLMQKAYDHRERLSDAERYLVIASYYERGPHQDFDKMMSAFESLLDLQPNHPTALNNAAVQFAAARQPDKAEQYFRRAVAGGFAPAVTYSGLANNLAIRGRFDEARAVLASGDSAYPGSVVLAQTRSRAMYLAGQTDSAVLLAERQMRERANEPATVAVNAGFLGAVAEAHGRLREAARWLDQARDADIRRGLRQATLARTATAASTRVWLFGDRTALTPLDKELAEHPLDALPILSRPYIAVAIPYALAGRSDRVRDLTVSFTRSRQSVQQLADSVTEQTLAGLQALAERRYEDAVRAFRVADATGCWTCMPPLIANAWDLANQPDSAIAAYETFLTRSDFTRFLRDRLYLATTHRRLGELYEARSERQKALSHYLAFVDLWKNADPELQPKVAEVRQRITRLQRLEGR
jgi:tetratricopeptide (TPR) repeat protein